MPPIIVPIPCYASECRVLRWTQCQGTPSTITDINGNTVVNPDSIGPPGWYLTTYDDSAWAAPVVVSDTANATGTVFEPGVLRYHLPNLGISGGEDLLLEGDPIWITDPETVDNMSTMLVRWRFTMPAGVAGLSSTGGPAFGLFFNNALGQRAVGEQSRFDYLNISHPLGVPHSPGWGDQQPILGQDAFSGAAYLGRAVAGQENLLCMALSAPYRGFDCLHSRSITESYFIHEILCCYAGPPAGTSASTFAWGYNGFGQLGVGDTVDKYVPTLLATDVVFEEVVGCRSASWGRTLDGTVYAWGHNGSGQLGNGLHTPTSNPEPILLTTLSGITSIAAGGATEDNGRCFALALTGELYGWGDNTSGALGAGGTVPQPTPLLVNTNVLRMASGGAHTVAIRIDGTVQATGRGTSGQLGNGLASSAGWVDVTPAGAVAAVDVACGVDTTWLLMADGTVLGAGQSSLGQVQFFPSGNVSTWTRLSLDAVASISTSGNTLYMLRSNGEAWAQGSNISGELGATILTFKSPERAMSVPSGVTFAQIPDSHPVFGASAIALGSDALAYTWGAGDVGQRGDGVTGPSVYVPTLVPNLEGVRWVGGGASSLFADTGGVPTAPVARGHSWGQIVG